VRTSTDRQDAGQESQRRAILAEVERRGWTLISIYSDELSGKDLARPGLLQALEMVESGQCDGIMVAKLDRLSRSLIDFAGLLERAKNGGWNLLALDLQVDLSTPSGEMLASVLCSFAQFERRMIGERITAALAVKRSQGVRLGRPSSVEPELKERIKRMRSEGQTLWSICRTLESLGVPTSRGGKNWRPSSLSAVLSEGRWTDDT
jgi:DNA invertase Pin-like site-specific DNA recombinase